MDVEAVLAYRLSMSRRTIKIRTIAMMLKQIDDMLQPTPGREAAATLRPSAPIAIASGDTQAGMRERSRRDASHSSPAPMRRLAANASRTLLPRS
jgi:hypothetical protein